MLLAQGGEKRSSFYGAESWELPYPTHLQPRRALLLVQSGHSGFLSLLFPSFPSCLLTAGNVPPAPLLPASLVLAISSPGPTSL